MFQNERADCLYRAFGITIESETRIEDLLPADRSSVADVRILYGKLSESALTDSADRFELFEMPGRRILVSARAMYLEFERVGRFLVESGKEIVVDPDKNVSDHDLQPFLTGPVLAVLLHQRGCFVAHASAVVIGGAAVIFLGSKGDGKSTLAAHLQVRGHQLVSDDLVPVGFNTGTPVTWPGYPRVKLYEDTILAVGEQPERYPFVHKYVEKRSFRYTEKFPENPIEIRGAFVLSESDRVESGPMNSAAAFIELTKHSFLSRFLNAMNSRNEHFRQCERLVKSVPVMKLGRPRDFSSMNQVCLLLENRALELAARHTV